MRQQASKVRCQVGETAIGQGSLVCGVRNDLGNRNKGGVERAEV